MDSNHRPRAYQARALTTWAMSPCKFFGVSRYSRLWWRWWESNPWPPACRAGALPAELHPHFSNEVLLSFPFGHSKLNNKRKILALQMHYLSPSFWFWSTFKLQVINSAAVITYVLHRKEVIQPHLPIRLPCYDLTPIIEPTFDCCLLSVSSQASGVPDFHGLTGGVYKARERIHRGMLIRDY